MYKKSPIITVVLVCIGMIGFAIVNSKSVESPDNSLTQFSMSQCSNACWQGIEPGVTDKAKVNSILNNLGLDFTVKDIFPDYRLSLYSWGISNPRGDTFMGISVYDGIVTQVVAPIDVCVSNVIGVYDYPSEIYERNGYYYLVYGDERIIFSTNEYHNLSRISVAILVDSSTLPNYQYPDNRLSWDIVSSTFEGECK